MRLKSKHTEVEFLACLLCVGGPPRKPSYPRGDTDYWMRRHLWVNKINDYCAKFLPTADQLTFRNEFRVWVLKEQEHRHAPET